MLGSHTRIFLRVLTDLTNPYKLHGFYDLVTLYERFKSCYVLFTDYYELLRCGYGNITRFVELSRITTSNLRAF